MLVLGTRENDKVVLTFDKLTDADLARLLEGEPIVVTTTQVSPSKTKQGYQAPPSVRIDRWDVYQAKLAEKALEGAGKEKAT